MLRKTVQYTNVDGDLITKDVYFNLTANELIQKEAESGQTYSEKLKAIAAANKLQDIYPAVLEMMGQGYGVRTEDGDFEKDPTGAAWAKFQNTLAFQTLMDDLLINDSENNGGRLADFINGMLPASLVNQIKEQQATPGFRPGADVSRPTPPAQSAQPVAVTPAEPTPIDYTLPGQGGVIQQTSEPRLPEIPGQAPQQ